MVSESQNGDYCDDMGNADILVYQVASLIALQIGGELKKKIV